MNVNQSESDEWSAKEADERTKAFERGESCSREDAQKMLLSSSLARNSKANMKRFEESVEQARSGQSVELTLEELSDRMDKIMRKSERST
jgi:hypothetical protein